MTQSCAKLFIWIRYRYLCWPAIYYETNININIRNGWFRNQYRYQYWMKAYFEININIDIFIMEIRTQYQYQYRYFRKISISIPIFISNQSVSHIPAPTIIYIMIFHNPYSLWMVHMHTHIEHDFSVTQKSHSVYTWADRLATHRCVRFLVHMPCKKQTL